MNRQRLPDRDPELWTVSADELIVLCQYARHELTTEQAIEALDRLAELEKWAVDDARVFLEISFRILDFEPALAEPSR